MYIITRIKRNVACERLSYYESPFTCGFPIIHTNVLWKYITCKKEEWNSRSMATVQIYEKMGRDNHLGAPLFPLNHDRCVALWLVSQQGSLCIVYHFIRPSSPTRNNGARCPEVIPAALHGKKNSWGHVARFACPRQALDRRPAMTIPGDDGGWPCQRPGILHTNNRGYVAIDCPPRSPKRAP